MSWYSHDRWRPYVSVAARRHQAARMIARMKKAGREVAPIEIEGRKIAATFWGDAWCKNLEAYSDYSNRLPRGRTYVRNGSVIDLQIEIGRARSLVSGSEIYEVDIEIEPLARKRWTDVKGRCAGQIGSLVELLRGSISRGVMEIVTRKGHGLFPSPAEITLSCSCPDWASMCKHVAATLYGVGARLDHEPELLFTLRGVDPVEMVEAAVDQPPVARKSGRGRVLETGELSSVFGVDIDMGEAAPDDVKTPAKPARKTARKKAAKKGTSKAGGDDMRWRNRGRPERTPRPRAAKLSREALQRLHARASEFVEESVLLRELLDDVRLARGRLYFWREADDLMARITPLGPRSMLLESPRGNSWTEHKRGQLATVLEVLEGDTRGTFHGLGSLRGGKPSAQIVLLRDIGIPVRVLAEPRYWYSMHREPEIAEVNDAMDRVLVRFVTDGISGSFHGTCLYALRDGEWGCYVIKPSASKTVSTAEKWLDRRDWEDWS